MSCDSFTMHVVWFTIAGILAMVGYAIGDSQWRPFDRLTRERKKRAKLLRDRVAAYMAVGVAEEAAATLVAAEMATESKHLVEAMT